MFKIKGGRVNNKVDWIFITIFAILIIFGIGMLPGCQTTKPSVANVALLKNLSWEEGHPERKAWSEALRLAINNNLDLLSQAKGYEPFCSKLSTDFFAELFIQIAHEESSWNPKSVYHEPPPLNVDSIGLVQLSYESDKGYPGCGEIDKVKGNLTDPLVNIKCGVGIMASLISKDKILTSGYKSGAVKGLARYWSVMRSMKFNKAGDLAARESYNYIKTKTNQLEICK